jgi:hypothetical protein
LADNGSLGIQWTHRRVVVNLNAASFLLFAVVKWQLETSFVLTTELAQSRTQQWEQPYLPVRSAITSSNVGGHEVFLARRQSQEGSPCRQYEREIHECCSTIVCLPGQEPYAEPVLYKSPQTPAGHAVVGQIKAEYEHLGLS